MIAFLNENAGFIQVIFAGVVAIATSVYAILTAMMWKEMRHTNERLERPNVQAILEPGRSWGPLFELIIRNSGNAPVYDVTISVKPLDLPSWGDRIASELSLFNVPIPVLAEGQELRTKLFLYPDVVKIKGKDTKITFDIRYKTSNGREHTQKFDYKLDVYEGLSVYKKGSLNDVVKELEKVTKELSGLSGKFDKVIRKQDWPERLKFEMLEGKTDEESLTYFASAWADQKDVQKKDYDRFGEYKIQALCEALYDRLCFSNMLGLSEGTELREIFLRLARFQFFIDGGASSRKFLELGDKATEIIHRMRD